MSGQQPITLTINGEERTLLARPEQNLLRLLRDNGYMEVKCGCEEGDCGTCTVLLDGESVKSCVTPALACAGHTIWTVTGFSKEEHAGRVLRQAFADCGASQCGFCTPGMMTAGMNYLMHDGRADRAAIRAAISGNLCRCTGYKKIVDAIYRAATELAAAGQGEGK